MEEKKDFKKKKMEDGLIFIGSKPFMNYVKSIGMQFTTKGQKEVIVKARGNFINIAVNVSEFVRNKFLKEQNIKIKDIQIDSEEFKNKVGKMVSVSTIAITLIK